jgi:hypothetical protein
VISITLPSIHLVALCRTLDNIQATTRGPCQVIVCMPNTIQRSETWGNLGVTWVCDDERRGCAYAHHIAAQHATGEFIVPFADDHEFIDGWDEVAVDEFCAGEIRWLSSLGHRWESQPPPFCLGLRGVHSGHVGTNFGVYYPYWPMMRVGDVRRVGWISPDYERGFGDSDLAMRVWQAGGRCEWSEAGLLRPTPDDARKVAEDAASATVDALTPWLDVENRETLREWACRRPAAAYTDRDVFTFVARWAPVYGRGWPTRAIDDFNIDLRPEENSGLVRDRTIFENDSSFAQRVVRMTT